MTAAVTDLKSTRVATPDRPPSLALFLLSTLAQRLGIWVSGFPFPVVALLSPLILAIGLLKGRIKFSVLRGLLFSALAISIMLSFALGRREWSSPQSALLFAGLYAFWAFWAPTASHTYRQYVGRIAFWVGVFSLLAAVQYVGQFAYKSELWFSWRSIVPEVFLIEYNTLNEISYASQHYKGNGFFLLEPSTLSGLIARVFLLTVFVFGSLRYAVPFAIGLIFAFSGTGILFTLLFTMPFIALLVARRFALAPTLVVTALVACLIWLLWSTTFLGEYFIGRLDEFSNPRSSGFARFTSTLLIFERHMTHSAGEFLVGYGPGSFIHLSGGLAVETFGSGWIKLFVEYGLLGFTTFCLFFLYCVYSSTRSMYLALALLLQYLVLDGALLVPQLAFVTYAIFVLPVRNLEVQHDLDRAARDDRAATVS